MPSRSPPRARTPADTVPAPPRTRRGHGQVTMRDVAEAAGVTAITVSRYLREPHKVASDTAAQVEAALAATGYVPNKQAGLLASGRSNIVAAIVPNLAHSIFAESLQGLADTLQPQGLELLLASTDYSPEREAAQLRTLLGWRPAALVVTGRRHTAAARQLLADAQHGGTVVVEMWDHHPEAADGFTQVGFDHEAVGRAMARHLLEGGHRRLAWVDSGVTQDVRARERGDGCEAEARSAGAKLTRLAAPPGDPYDAGAAVLARLQAMPASKRPTACAFANDQLACGALLHAPQAGVRVPQDLALLGFGDFPVGRHLQPALSTMAPPRREIGCAAAEVVIDALAAGGGVPAHRLLPCVLQPRASTAGPRATAGRPPASRGPRRA